MLGRLVLLRYLCQRFETIASKRMEIKIENLKKSFGEKVAVDIPEFAIHSGEIIGLVGNNGAGKTTLFRLMLDLLQASEGRVLLTPQAAEGAEANAEPMDPARTEAWKAYTGAYIDDGFLIDFLTPEEYFDFVGRVCGMDKDAVKTRLADFEQFMSGEILGQKKYIRDLSAGNKQKVGIVAALLSRPQLVVLDEPFNFLDPSSQHVLKNLLTDYNRQTRATILVSSHNLQHTIEISTRIALLEHGVILKDLSNAGGSAEQELENYFEV